MADIREPAPIKPIWPARPERRTERQKQREQQRREEADRLQKEKGKRPSDKSSRIDDFA
jgi:hypothetical protein